jgi:hypothetical protein
MAIQFVMGAAGMVVGTVLGVGILHGLGVSDGGLATLLDVATPSFAGAMVASPLGIFSGVTGGIIGALVGVCFALLPFGWLFIHAPISEFVAAIITAFIISGLIPILMPH